MPRWLRDPVSSVAAWSAALLLSATLGACSDDPVLPPSPDGIRVAFGQDVSEWPRAPWTLRDAAVERDTLVLQVQYSGGCEAHDFWLLAVDGWEELPTAGPLDTRSVPLLLAHEDRGDACEAALTRSLRFDLDPLRRAYRDRFGRGAARLILRVPEGQGSDRTLDVLWEI